jgi:GPH family glycoside/pentoside/hexuronide:cation symporter
LTHSPGADFLAAEPLRDLARSRKLGLRTKLLCGVGALVDGVTATSLTYFLLFYLTAVRGLSGTLAGVASMGALLVDAVADPAIGLLSDNTRSRFAGASPSCCSAPCR